MNDMEYRFKDYEQLARTTLPRRAPIIVRIDGKAFHTYTRHMDRPFSVRLAHAMDQTARELCQQIQGVVCAYTQSDEISLVIHHADRKAQPWFDGEVQKIVSVSASIATAMFNGVMLDIGNGKLAHFDSRVFTVPDLAEAANYLIWRQRDAVRNSISMAAQAVFSHSQLHGVGTNAMQEMLFAEKGINWNDYPARFKRGGWVTKHVREKEVTWTHKQTKEVFTDTALRTEWDIEPAPSFVFDELHAHLQGPVKEEESNVPATVGA